MSRYFCLNFLLNILMNGVKKLLIMKLILKKVFQLKNMALCLKNYIFYITNGLVLLIYTFFNNKTYYCFFIINIV